MTILLPPHTPGSPAPLLPSDLAKFTYHPDTVSELFQGDSWWAKWMWGFPKDCAMWLWSGHLHLIRGLNFLGLCFCSSKIKVLHFEILSAEKFPPNSRQNFYLGPYILSSIWKNCLQFIFFFPGFLSLSPYFPPAGKIKVWKHHDNSVWLAISSFSSSLLPGSLNLLQVLHHPLPKEYMCVCA